MHPLCQSQRRSAPTVPAVSLVALWIASATLACSSPAEPVRVLMIGDSFSVKGGEFVGGVTPGPSFADQVELDLGDGYEFINVACPGSSAIDWSLNKPGILCPPFPWYEFPNGLLRERALPELPVDIATVLLGTNDSIPLLEPVPVTPEAYDEALGELIDALLEGGARHVLLMTPPDLGNTDAHLRLQAFRQKALARCDSSERVICGPDFFTLLDRERDFTNGELHPNARGHARMAKALGASIRRISGPQSRGHSLLPFAVLALPLLLPLGVARSATSC